MAKDITNQRFGNLVALERIDKNKHNEWRWKCICDCGNETITNLRNLVHGKVTSCGRCNSFTIGGKTQTVAEWSRELGLSPDTLHHRIHDYNWSINDALSKSTSRNRTNAERERRLVILAIENISSTKLARERGLGATRKEIKEYTKLTAHAVKTTLSWLQEKGILTKHYRRGHYFVTKHLPNNFCFKHGITEQFGGRCIKCVKAEGR